MKYYWFLHLRRGKKNYRKWAFLIQVPLDTCFVLNEYLQVGWQLLYHLFIHNTAFHWCYVYLIGDVYTVEALLLQATGSLATVSPARNVFFYFSCFLRNREIRKISGRSLPPQCLCRFFLCLIWHLFPWHSAEAGSANVTFPAEKIILDKTK